MKKRLLFATMLITPLCLPAQNVIMNGDFELAGTTIDVVTSTATPEPGIWATYLAKDKTGFTIETQQDTEYGTVAVLATESAAPGWYQHFLMQNIASAPKAEVYRLSFDIKSTSATKAKLTTQIYCGNNNYVFRDGFDLQGGKAGGSASTYEVQATDAWQHIELLYDFSQMCNNVNSPKSVNKVDTPDEDLTLFKVEPTTEALLNQCRLTINAYKAKPNVLLIDNIKLEPVNSEPPYTEVPDEGDLLVHNDFEGITTLNRMTAETDKFADTPGEWYFYAEAGLAGIDGSTAEIKDAGDPYGNVVSLINGEKVPSWWGHTLMQRLAAKAQPAIYRLSFYARSNAQSKATVMVNTKQRGADKAEFVLKEGFDPIKSATSSGARYDITTSSTWQYYECTFDFSQKCNNYNSPSGVGETYAITPTDNDFLQNCYLSILNQTGSSELMIDNIAIEEVLTYTTMQNTGFEENMALPIMLTEDLALGAHSGQWVLVAKGQEVGNVSVSSSEASTGEKSMKLDVEELSNKARYSFFMAMDLYEVPGGDYIFKFSSKADKADIPFRLDIYAYNGSDAQAITGADGSVLTTTGIDNASAGLKMFTTTTSWVDYAQKLTIPEDISMLRIFIRPNITSLGAAGPQADSFPMSYWFDDFTLEKSKPVGVENIQSGDIGISVKDGRLSLNGLNSANIVIYTIQGAMVDTVSLSGDSTYSLKQGVYIVKVQSQHETKAIKVLVK